MGGESIVELTSPPKFEYGEKVKLKKHIRNDGTFPGREVGEILVHKGDEGYISQIGTFLQQFYIYGVYFAEKGFSVGCRARELESLDYEEDEE